MLSKIAKTFCPAISRTQGFPSAQLLATTRYYPLYHSEILAVIRTHSKGGFKKGMYSKKSVYGISKTASK
jgi:hypothetical protein